MSSRRIGNYQITDYIGSGGFGSVFKAEDVNTPGRVVAIKELHKKHTRNQVIKQRFFQEAVAMARLDHPNLPRLYTFGEDNGSYYLVMEFISGKLLSDELHESGPMRSDMAAVVLTQVIEAVSYAHRNGIIHRDLKPDNIILVGDGSSLRVKVLDFGIARMIGGESLTLAGEGFGTPSYMAPERMTGAGGDDPRMDLYAAGIILFEMLTGKAPFESKASDPALYWVEMRDLHERAALPALAPLGVPEGIERVALRATAKLLTDRYQTADDMLADLKALGDVRADLPTVVLTSARLMLSTAPGGAEVYVDDVLRGTSDVARGKILIEGLKAGLHSVRVLKEAYNEYKINVSLEDGGQTDLQVSLSARATVEMPRADITAASGLATLKLPGTDEIKTAMVVVESLPAGSTVFVGSDAVALAGDDGRATLRLAPGAHQIRALTPAGVTTQSVVSVTAQDTIAPKTMTLPIAQTTVTAATAAGVGKPSKTGKQLASAAVLVLLVALATGAYFVLRGPDRTRTQTEVAVAPPVAAAPVVGPPAQQPVAPVKATESNDNQKATEDKKKAADERRKAEEAAAAIEAQKKAEAKALETAQKKDKASQAPPAAPVQQPSMPAPPVSTPPASSAPSRDACVFVSVNDADGQPVPRVRVQVVDQSDGGSSTLFNGRTGPQGRCQACGVVSGHSVRVAVGGPQGRVIGTQTIVARSGKNFVTISLPGRMEDAPIRPFGPNRKRPFRIP